MGRKGTYSPDLFGMYLCDLRMRRQGRPLIGLLIRFDELTRIFGRAPDHDLDGRELAAASDRWCRAISSQLLTYKAKRMDAEARTKRLNAYLATGKPQRHMDVTVEVGGFYYDAKVFHVSKSGKTFTIRRCAEGPRCWRAPEKVRVRKDGSYGLVGYGSTGAVVFGSL